MDDETIDEVVKIIVKKTFPKGAPVYHQDEAAGGFYVVARGSIRLYKTGESGKEIVMAIARAGMAFAEATLFGNGKFAESAVAHEDTETLFLPRAEFLQIVSRNAPLARSLTESVCRWLSSYSMLVENLNLSSVRERVGRYLKRAMDEQGTSDIRLKDKKFHIALQLGVRPETLSRALAELEQEAVIAVKGAQIRVLKPEKL